MATTEVRTGIVPHRALLLSLVSLWVPIAASAMVPEWITGDIGVLVWMLALVPGFLLSYYRGWQGAALALAGGMAALSIAQALLLLVHATAPRPEVLFGVVTVLTVVSLGSGVLSTLFHRMLDRAERMALTDAGTGMPNRRHAILELEKAFAAAQRGADLTVVLFDLDHFKRVNDRHGHAEGDRVLVKFADILQSITRAMHVTARFGGEEFVAVLRGVGPGGARIYAERVRQRLAELVLPCGPVTVSAGVAAYEPGMASPDVLLAAADQALYRAKDAGRDRVVVLDRAGRRTEAPDPSAGARRGGGAARPRGAGAGGGRRRRRVAQRRPGASSLRLHRAGVTLADAGRGDRARTRRPPGGGAHRHRHAGDGRLPAGGDPRGDPGRGSRRLHVGLLPGGRGLGWRARRGARLPQQTHLHLHARPPRPLEPGSAGADAATLSRGRRPGGRRCRRHRPPPRCPSRSATDASGWRRVSSSSTPTSIAAT